MDGNETAAALKMGAFQRINSDMENGVSLVLPMGDKLFVYGTLGPGRPNAHILEKIGGKFIPAHIKGRLKAAGWGAEMGFPGFIPDEAGERIAGFVFVSGNLVEHWAQLDAFEGEGYRRVRICAELGGGGMVEAWVYALSGCEG